MSQKKKSRSIEKEGEDQPNLLGEEEKVGDEPQVAVEENSVEDKADTRVDTKVDTQEQDKKVIVFIRGQRLLFME